MKERVVDRKYDPLVWLGNKIFRRTGRRGRHGARSVGRAYGPSHLRERQSRGWFARPDTWA